MKKPQFDRGISIKLSERQRTAIELLAERGQITLGHAARLLLDRGLQTLQYKRMNENFQSENQVVSTEGKSDIIKTHRRGSCR